MNAMSWLPTVSAAPESLGVPHPAPFELLSPVRAIETIARGRGIRDLDRLIDRYGAGHWLKRRGIARIRLPDGTIRNAELHWYEAQGIGRKALKIKRYLNP